MSSPAETIISKLGGVEAVAAICAVDVSRVYRWTYAKSAGGTDGLIPTRHQQAILDHSRENKLGVKPADFFRSEAAA
mgnify:CR=1 FL=1